MNKMNVVWLTRSSAKYKMDLLDEIGKEVNLTILFIEHKNKQRASGFYSDMSGNYKIVWLNEFSEAKEHIQKADIFVDSYYASKWGYYCTSIAKKYGIPTILYADGGIAVKRFFLIEKMIGHFMNKHDYILSSSEVTDKYFNYYLKKPKKTYHYHMSSLKEQDILTNKKYFEDKDKYKKELNLQEFTFISVGQMIPRKGFDILLKAYAESGLNACTKLLMIGGKPYEELVKLKDELGLTNATFIDAIPKEELNKYYAASDAFVFATREDIWGLVVNEALSFGLPLISSDNCVAAEHFNQYENVCVLVKNEDVQGFASAMKQVYENTELRNDLSRKAIEKSYCYTIEQASKDIINVLNDIRKDK